jgi:ribonuclease D
MALLLGESKTGLAALLEQGEGIRLDKKHQRADWGRRPLTTSQVRYAAADTAFLGRLAGRLRMRLKELGRWEWALEEFRRLEQVRYVPVEPDPMAFERVKGVRSLRDADRDRAFSLFEWREAQAQRLDIPPFKVLGNKTLLHLAQRVPGGLSELEKADGVGPRFVRRWGRQVLEVVTRPHPAPSRVRHARDREPPAVVRRRLKRLVLIRDEVTAEAGLDPGFVCPRNCALAVASREPRCATVIDLKQVGLDGWRLGLLADRFLEVLADE